MLVFPGAAWRREPLVCADDRSEWKVMRNFYNKALAGLLCLMIASVLLGYLCERATYTRLPLVPAGESGQKWQAETIADNVVGGHSTARLLDDSTALNFEFTSAKGVDYPFAKLELAFRDRAGKPVLVDLSRYDSAAFDVRCAPANTMAFGLLTFEQGVSVPGDDSTHRPTYAYFFCNERTRRVEIELSHLRTDPWWYDRHKLNLSQQENRLDKVAKISFGDTFQSPYDVLSRVQVLGLSLQGRDLRYRWVFAVCMVLAWPAYGLWFFRQHARCLVAEVRDKMRRDIPLVAYQQLSQDLRRDKEENAILRFMATEYTNPELDVETMVTTLGINRNKINEILKAELGFTFSTYLNKLRLTEAARLLGEKEETSVAEIAYSVGYRNVSYFNKLFKEEYGCTPKTFRKVRDTSMDEAAT